MFKLQIRGLLRYPRWYGLRKFSRSAINSAADYSHVVIGGGVVGQAIAAELAKINSNSVLLLEKNDRFGTETSSHNSEVIHAGIYYPADSLKTKLCIEGKNIIYNELDWLKTGVSWNKCGKWVVAQTDYEESINEVLYHKCKDELDVDVKLISAQDASRMEPSIRVEKSALSSPSTGIINSHSLMDYLLGTIQQNDGDTVTGSEVVGLEYKNGAGYIITTKEKYSDEDEVAEITAENVINSAGLYADQVSNMLLPKDRLKKLHFAKGNYFKLKSGGFPSVGRLIYPVPPADGKSLGTHLTIDMNGQILFGPDLEYVGSRTNYTTNSENIPAAFEAISRYYPHIQVSDLDVASCGIRPKLCGPDTYQFNDYYIKEEEGFPGFVNLLGIESPGLTSSIAIGRYVKRIYHG